MKSAHSSSISKLNFVSLVRSAAITNEAEQFGYVVAVTGLCACVALSIDVINQLTFFESWPEAFRSWAITTVLVLVLAAPISRMIAKAQLELYRVKMMLAALNAAQDAFLRATSPDRMFTTVCDAVVDAGDFTACTIAMATPGGTLLQIRAAKGLPGGPGRPLELPAEPRYLNGHGLAAIAFETGETCFTNDYQKERRRERPADEPESRGMRSYAALPLFRGRDRVGVMLFGSLERNAFNPAIVDLMKRLAENVSSALEGFDQSAKKALAEARVAYLATHDGLTELPNRALFAQRVRNSLEGAAREGRKPAVLFIDLDRFKVVNDSLGHDAGDVVLVEIARRLRGGVSGLDMVARLGGDEFGVILDAPADRPSIESTARAILRAIEEPLELEGLDFRVGASIGAAVFPEDGADDVVLRKNADKAMYAAKGAGKNEVRFYVAAAKQPRLYQGLALEQRLREALDREEFSLRYQPKVDATTHEVVGLEVLLRWTTADMGTLSPKQFIPLAEETGLIIPIGRWVLSQACAQTAAWRQQGLKPLPIAVNISPRQFLDANLLDDIDRALRDSGMKGHQLQLEITETTVIRDVEHAIETLDLIRRRGVRLAIDDFGTGYSSMSLMKAFPIDTLKIDHSFVSDLPADAEDRAITRAIIHMGKALGLRLVAEGVETAAQAEFLRRNHCDELQGFLFSRPLPPTEIPAYVAAAASLARTRGSARSRPGPPNPSRPSLLKIA